MNLGSSGCGNHQFGCTFVFPPLAFELNAHSVSLSKPRASISLATAEPFQSLDLDHILLIKSHRFVGGYATHTRHQIWLRDAGLKIQNFEKLWHFPCRRWTEVRAAV